VINLVPVDRASAGHGLRLRCGAQLPAELAHVCLDGVRGVVFDAATAPLAEHRGTNRRSAASDKCGSRRGPHQAFHSAASDDEESSPGQRPAAASAGRCRSRQGPGPGRRRDGRPRLVLRQSGSGSERRGDMVLAQPRPPKRSASVRAHDSTIGAIVSARDRALSLPPKLSGAAPPNRASRATIAFLESDRPNAPQAGDAYGDQA
jgi:hypothetical protein